MGRPVFWWLGLLLVALSAWGAVSWTSALRSRLQAETREAVLYAQLDEVFAGEVTAENVIRLNPEIARAAEPALKRATAQVDATVWRLRHSDTGDDSGQAVRHLTSRMAAYHRDVAVWEGLFGSGRLGAADRVYQGRMRAARQGLGDFIRTAAAKQKRDVKSAEWEAFVGSLLGYGGAGLIVSAVLLGLMFLLRHRERRQAAARLEAADQRYAQIVNTAQEGVWTTDRDGRITFVNEACARMLGLGPDEPSWVAWRLLALETRRSSCREIA